MNTQIQDQVQNEQNVTKNVQSSELRLVRVSTRAEFSTLEHEWDQLIEQMQIPSPFLTWDYLDVWWATYGNSGYDVQLFIARDENGQLIGAVPLMTTNRGAFPGARGRFRHLAFMGGVGEMLGESLELPAMRGYEKSVGEAAANLILGTLQGKWEALYFYLVPQQSVSTHTMMDRLKEAGIPIQRTYSLSSPYLETNGMSWDDYLASKSKSFRKNFRYSHNLSERRFAMKKLHVGEDISMKSAMDHLVRLATARWGAGAQAFHTPEFVTFHRKLAPRFHKKNRLMFHLIELNGEIAGAAYDFIYANKGWGYQAPWDQAFQKASPGFLLNVWSLKTSFDLGLKEFDMLPGDTNYKGDWTDNEHTLNIYEAACPRNLGGTLYSIARGIDRLLSGKS